MGQGQRMGVSNREMGWDSVGGAGWDDQESGRGRVGGDCEYQCS